MANPYDPQSMNDMQRRQYTDYSRGIMNDWMTQNNQPYMVSGGGAGGPSREQLGIADEATWMQQNGITGANPGYREAELAQSAQRDAMIQQNLASDNAARTAMGLGPQTGVGSTSSNPYMAPQSTNLGMTQPAPAAQPTQPSTLGRNPWLQQQGQALQAQSNQNLMQNVLPSIGRGAQAAGMYGSSRQGTAEGQAIGNAQTGLNSALAGMYSQSYGQDQSYDLGLRGNDLGFANLDANINQNNFGNQLQSANFGLGVYDRMNSYGQQDISNSTNMQNTPLNYFNQFNQNANAIAGQGGTSTSSQNNPGNPYIGALGGLQLGSQLFK